MVQDMFAGRYIRWMLVAVATFLFFAVYFGDVVWAAVYFSGCGRHGGDCEPIVTFFHGLRPAGFWLSAGILLAVMIARLAYLRLGPIWMLMAATWFLPAMAFPAIFRGLYHGYMSFFALPLLLPSPLFFLVVFAIYLLIPFEDGRWQPFGPWRPLRYVATFAAADATFLALSVEPGLGAFLRTMHMPHVASLVSVLQPPLRYVAQFGNGGIAPAFIMLGFFVVCLLAGLLPPSRVEAARAWFHDLMLPDSFRRSDRA